MFSKIFKRKPQTYEKTRAISCSQYGEVFAVSEYAKNVQIWNINGQLIRKFETDLDSGSSQSLTISNNGSKLIVAGYDNNTITCFDIVSNSIIWQRTDLKKPFLVTILEDDEGGLFIDTEKQGCYLLNQNTGETLEKLKGIREIKESPYSKTNQIVKSSSSVTIDRVSKKVIHNIKHNGSLLDSVFTENLLVCAFSCGPIEAIDLKTNEVLWSKKVIGHFIQTGFNSLTQKILAIRWDYEKGGAKFLTVINIESGIVEREINLGEPIEVAFGKNGEFVLTSLGKLYETKELKEIKLFDFENN